MLIFSLFLLKFILLNEAESTVICDKFFQKVTTSCNVLKEGFHRDLEINVELFVNPDETPNKLNLLLKQILPPSTYIDPYQQVHFTTEPRADILLPGLINVEATAQDSPFIPILLYWTLNSTSLNSGVNLKISLPVHIRYHQPQNDRKFISFHIPPPLIYVKNHTISSPDIEFNINPCDATNTSQCSWCKLQLSQNSTDVYLQVPVGQTQHLYMVLTVTTLVTLACCFYLSLIIWKQP